MAGKYEQYIIRKPGTMHANGKLGQPVAVEKIKPKSKADTGPLIWWSPKLVKGAKCGIESGIISGEKLVGTGGPNSFQPHKTMNQGGEFFMFLGTNPEDPMDLGAEAEFYLGEGKDTEKVVINTSTCVWVPPGVGHFPLRWKNVKRPVMFVVFVPSMGEEEDQSEFLSMEGRPTE
jgi:hypothetical protein